MPLPQLGFKFQKAADLLLGIYVYHWAVPVIHPRLLCGGLDLFSFAAVQRKSLGSRNKCGND